MLNNIHRCLGGNPHCRRGFIQLKTTSLHSYNLAIIQGWPLFMGEGEGYYSLVSLYIKEIKIVENPSDLYTRKREFQCKSLNFVVCWAESIQPYRFLIFMIHINHIHPVVQTILKTYLQISLEFPCNRQDYSWEIVMDIHSCILININELINIHVMPTISCSLNYCKYLENSVK